MSKPHNHDHLTCVEDAIKKAENICEHANLRFTPSRKKVLEIIWQSHQGSKAYDILSKLQAADKSAKPPTVYRALDFLEENGLIHKVESNNTYFGCNHPENPHDKSGKVSKCCQLIICDSCSNIEEFCDDAVFRSIENNIKKHGFKSITHTIEIRGLCKNCQ